MNKSPTAGFSLIELLTVLALVATLAVAALPAVSSLAGTRGVSRAAYDVSSHLEQARAYAMARGTFVWVGLANMRNPDTGSLAVTAFAFASRDGSSDQSAQNLVPLSKPVEVPNVALADVSQQAFASRRSGNNVLQVTDLPVANETFPFPTQFSTISGLRVVQIRPSGEAEVQGAQKDWSAFRWLEIGLRQARGETISEGPDGAAVQMAGLTGQVQVFRP